MQIFKRVQLSSALLLGALLPTICFSSSFDDENQDQSIPVGNFILTPIVKFQQRYDSNVASEKSDDIDSWLTVFQPSVKLTREFGEFGKHNIEFDWIFTHGAYHASGNDSYNDHEISSKLNYELNERNRMTVQGGYIDAHEERGSRFSIGTGDGLEEPDTYEQIFASMQYAYGTETADARIELEAGYLDNNYRSVYVINDETGEEYDSTKTRDRVTTEYGGKLYYKIGAATDITLEAYNTDFNYDYTETPSEELSSVESRALIGLKWEATALTTGFAKLGYKEKDFDISGRENFDNTEWEVEILWEPKTYSHFTFRSGRSTEETNGEGYFDIGATGLAYFINGTENAVEWKHEWKDRISTKVEYAELKDVYKGDEGTVRIDDNVGVSAAVYYDMSYWLSFSFEYTFNDRESTRENLEYDRNLATFGVRIALY
ncbi:MAG: outer membrane beta-barrel protein [Colwellia sp.]